MAPWGAGMFAGHGYFAGRAICGTLSRFPSGLK